MRIDTELEEWEGSAVVRFVGRGYARLPAERFRDEPARLSRRQAVFYKNLISLALAVGGNCIPVDFEDSEGKPRYLDRGCIKIAEHARFIEALKDDEDGVVSHIILSWSV